MKNLNYLLILFFIILSAKIYAQKEFQKEGSVIYKTFFAGNEASDEGIIKLEYRNGTTSVTREYGNKTTIAGFPLEKTLIDYNAVKIFQCAVTKNGTFYTETSQEALPVLEYLNEYSKILGYKCQKAKTTLRSNTIEIWFTSEAGILGSPSITRGMPKGLVLKIVQNGNMEIIAQEIKFNKQKNKTTLISSELGTKTEPTEYRSKLIESYVISVPVFSDDQICFGKETVYNPELKGNVTYSFANGTIIAKKVKLPEVSADYSVFAELSQYSNGDAYDRTGTVFMLSENGLNDYLHALQTSAKSLPSFMASDSVKYYGFMATDKFSPPVELIRFYTPFGVKQFNDKVSVKGQTWEDSAYYKQDITELLPVLKNEVWICAFISNYDKGGHKVNMRLKYYPGSKFTDNLPPKKQWVHPLFNTTNVMEVIGQEYPKLFGTDTLFCEFTIPANVKNVRMRYISTGHGGWENGDEFNQKINEICLNGNRMFSYIPWRTDCATYRNYNPASGNFWNGLSSSDLSRSGWCPGTITNPMFFPFFDLEEGKHRIGIYIPMGKNEGSSFSSWNISGVLIGDYIE